MKLSEAQSLAKLPICYECGLPHWTSRLSGVCAACRYFELTQTERSVLANVIDFIRSNDLCAYCGEYATDVEHVVPRVSGLSTYTVPACHECNAIAGGRVFISFEDKAAFIQGRLRKRYLKVLRTPEWSEDEMKDLGYAMRQEVLAYNRARSWVRQRLDWSLATALLMIEHSS